MKDCEGRIDGLGVVSDDVDVEEAIEHLLEITADEWAFAPDYRALLDVLINAYRVLKKEQLKK